VLRPAFDRYSFFLENLTGVKEARRQVVRCGAMHYFRLPSQAMWRNRLLKLKAAHYNAVDLYCNWAYHSPAEGVYEFENEKDIKALLAMAAELGLWVILRPGPYINAETSGGGFPGWVLGKTDLTLRCIKEHQHEWCDTYMGLVRQWWEALFPHIKEAPNLLMLQIENEYVTEELEPDYIQALYDLARELGVKVPLSHNDVYTLGCYGDVVDIYSFDHYPTRHFKEDWRDNAKGMLSLLDSMEVDVRPYCEERPLYIAELQSGWFAPWKGERYEAIVEGLDRSHLRLVTKTACAQGMTVFNHYMAVGSTSWGFIGSTDSQSTYDFAAPIAETGDLRPTYYEAKAWNQFLEAFPVAATQPVTPESLSLTATDAYTGETLEAINFTARRIVAGANPGAHWLILRNLGKTPQSVTLTLPKPYENELTETIAVTLPALDAVWLPLNLRLLSGVMLYLSTTELLYQTPELLILKGDRDATLLIEGADGKPVKVELKALAPERHTAGQLGNLKVIVLGAALVDRFWVEADGSFVLGADEKLEDAHYLRLSTSSLPLFRIQPNGQFQAYPPIVEAPEVLLAKAALPVLGAWEFRSSDPWTVDSLDGKALFPKEFQALDLKQPLDMDSLGFYEGSLWYCFTFNKLQAPVQLALAARHLWALVNPHRVLVKGQALKTSPEKAPLEAVPITIYPNGEETQQVFLFCDYLGHPKGFFHDSQESGGLQVLELPESLDRASFSLSVAPAMELSLPPQAPLPETPCLTLLAKTTFALPAGLEEPQAPALGVRVSPVGWERVDLYWNGQLFGRFWAECAAQQVFYIPTAFLKAGEPNTLTVAMRQLSSLPKASQWQHWLATGLRLEWMSEAKQALLLQ
jgi:hypothetical protein